MFVYAKTVIPAHAPPPPSLWPTTVSRALSLPGACPAHSLSLSPVPSLSHSCSVAANGLCFQFCRGIYVRNYTPTSLLRPSHLRPAPGEFLELSFTLTFNYLQERPVQLNYDKCLKEEELHKVKVCTFSFTSLSWRGILFLIFLPRPPSSCALTFLFASARFSSCFTALPVRSVLQLCFSFASSSYSALFLSLLVRLSLSAALFYA